VADHEHLGKLMAYSTALRADIAVWAVAAVEPPFLREQLDFLSSLNEVYAGSRQFAAVTVTLESDPSPVPLSQGAPLIPRMRRAVPESPCGAVSVTTVCGRVLGTNGATAS
jgi:hypothetical protein